MTVQTEESRTSVDGSGVTGPFTIPFYFLADPHIVVIRVTIATGAETLLALTTDYTLSGAGDEAGGTLTLTVALSASYRLVIYRDPDLLQETRYPRNDPFPAATHERTADKAMMIDQRTRSLIERSIRQSEGDAADIGPLPSSLDRASMYLGFDADGEPIALAGTFLAGDISSYTATRTNGGTSRTVRQRINDYIHVADYGVVGDGVTDDTAAFNEARSLAIAARKRLFIAGRLLISSQLTIADQASEHWVFDGASGVGDASNYPGSYLIKKSTMSGPCVLINGTGSVVDGGGIVGQAGNAGDGFQINAPGVVLNHPYTFGMGQDGIRVGHNVSGGGANANLFRIIRPSCHSNGRHGIFVDSGNLQSIIAATAIADYEQYVIVTVGTTDFTTIGAASNTVGLLFLATGAGTGSGTVQRINPDANAGIIDSPFCALNAGDGVKFGRAWNNSMLNPLVEGNAGYGIHFDIGSADNDVVGGDISEANTAGDLHFHPDAERNVLYGTYPGVPVTSLADIGSNAIVGGFQVGMHKSGSFTRDLSAASGNVTISVGFRPSFIEFDCVVSGTTVVSVGSGDGATAHSRWSIGGAAGVFYSNTNRCITAEATSGNYQIANIDNFGWTGFTLTWTKVGTPTGTLSCHYKAHR